MNNEILICDICKNENTKNVHYCINCGNNLSDITELTDMLFFMTKLINFVASILFICLTFGTFFISVIFLAFGAKLTKIFSNICIYLLIPYLLILVISYLIKQYAIKKCKDNLIKYGGGSYGKN